MTTSIDTAPINNLPLGLLDFLGIKNYGVNPRFLGNIVQPTFEMRDYYQGNSQPFVPTNSNAIAPGIDNQFITMAGSPANVVVPFGECWMLLNMHSTVVGIGVGETVSLTLAQATLNATTNLPVFGNGEFLSDQKILTGIADGGAGFQVVMNPAHRGRIFPSGSYFTAYVGNYTGAGAPTVNVGLKAIRLLV